MCKEDYVSFKTAKLLKEKGFDCNCDMYYTSTGSVEYTQLKLNHNELESRYSKPTLQTAMKWLREVHYLWVDIDPLTNYKWIWSIWFMDDPDQKMGESLQSIATYDEACESAIKYCLENLI